MSDQLRPDHRTGESAMSMLSSQRDPLVSHNKPPYNSGYPQPMAVNTPHMSSNQHFLAVQQQRTAQSPHSFKAANPRFQPLNNSNIYLQDSSALRHDTGSMPRPRPPPAGLYDSSASVIRPDGSWARANPPANGAASPTMHFQPPPGSAGPPQTQTQIHPQARRLLPAGEQYVASPHAQNPYANQPRPSEAEIRLRNEAQMRVLRRNMANAGVLRVLDVIDLVTLGSRDQLSNLVYWQRLVAGNFLPSSLVTIHFGPSDKHALETSNMEGNGAHKKQQSPFFSRAGFTELLLPLLPSAVAKLYKLQMATFPRLLLTAAQDLQVAKLDMSLSSVECQVLSNAFINMSGKIVLHYVYVDGSRATVDGRFSLQLNRELRILLIDYWVLDYTPSINLDRLTQQREPPSSHRGNTKNFVASIIETCHAKLRSALFGFGEATMRTMKLSDIMFYLKPIINLGALRRIDSPHEAMEAFVAMNRANHGSSTPRRTEFDSIKEDGEGPDQDNNPKRLASSAFEYEPHAANAMATKNMRR